MVEKNNPNAMRRNNTMAGAIIKKLPIVRNS